MAFHQLLVYKAIKFYNAQTSKDLYDVNDLTEIKIPALSPYITDWARYEDVSGRVDFKDASYNYVKMKITKEGIYLMCVPNYSTTRLSPNNVISDKQIKDIPVHPKSHVPFGKIKALDNFKFSFAQFAFNATVKHVKNLIAERVHGVFSHTLDIPEQPPKSPISTTC